MLIKINGRQRFFQRIDSVSLVRPGRYEVTAGRFTFLVEGGRASGGAANEWFVHADGEIFNATVFASSLVDALKQIDTV